MKITVHGVVIEGTREELQDALDMLLERAVRQGEQVADETVVSNTPQQTVPLTAEEFRHLWPQLSAGSRAVLAEVATRPQGYPVADLLARLGVPFTITSPSLNVNSHRLPLSLAYAESARYIFTLTPSSASTCLFS